MKKISFLLSIILITILLFSCQSKSTLEIETLNKNIVDLNVKIEALQKENSDLKQQNEKLINSSSYLYSEAVSYFQDSKYDDAKKMFTNIISKYPNSEEAKNSKVKITEIDKKVADIKKAEEEKKRAYEESIKPPLQLVKTWVGFNSIDNPEAYLVVKNISKKTIDAFNVGVYCFDRYDNPVNHYLYDTNKFGGISQDTIKPGQSHGYNNYWTLFGHENTSKIKVVLEKVHMTDGTEWVPANGQEISINGKSSK